MFAVHDLLKAEILEHQDLICASDITWSTSTLHPPLLLFTAIAFKPNSSRKVSTWIPTVRDLAFISTQKANLLIV
jgi:hypothetical protein